MHEVLLIVHKNMLQIHLDIIQVLQIKHKDNLHPPAVLDKEILKKPMDVSHVTLLITLNSHF